MSASLGEIGNLIRRVGVTARSSLAVSHGGTSYFAVTPDAPYDRALSAFQQTRQLLAKAEGRLEQIGSRKDLLLFVAIILADMADRDSVNAEWDRWFDGVGPPARCCFEARLANPDMKVEMIMVCASTG